MASSSVLAITALLFCCYVSFSTALSSGIYIPPEIVKGYQNGTYTASPSAKRAFYDLKDKILFHQVNYNQNQNTYNNKRNGGGTINNPTRLPIDTPLFGKRQISDWCEGQWHAELQYPYMTRPLSLWSGMKYVELKDLTNQRFVVHLETPFGPIAQWTSQQGTWLYSSLTGVCTYQPEAIFGGPLDYLEVARNTLLKKASVSFIDIYRGAAREPTEAYLPMARYMEVDSRTNVTVYEEWVQDNARPRNPDGSCPFSTLQFAGSILYDVGCFGLASKTQEVGQAAIESYFELSPACIQNPTPVDGLCWH